MSPNRRALRVASLFSGIGGIELGFEQAGHETVMLCESDPHAVAVLEQRFPGVPIHRDVTCLDHLPNCEVLTAGWPCQDISLAGSLKGLSGEKSGLISHVFRLLEAAPSKPDYVLLENVAFALELKQGEAVSYVTQRLEDCGYCWSYRILDTQEFGLPQRRRRVFILGSRRPGDAKVLLEGIGSFAEIPMSEPKMVGFYWTEGNRGVGWTPEAIPPLKSGSTLAIPSPPAIWDRTRSTFICPGITDAERLQGFPADWTTAAETLPRGLRTRWKLVGNAVSVPVSRWIGERLASDGVLQGGLGVPAVGKSIKAAYGGDGNPRVEFEKVYEGPLSPQKILLRDFTLTDAKLLSLRALSGFTRRYEVAPLRKNQEFLRDLQASLEILAAA